MTKRFDIKNLFQKCRLMMYDRLTNKSQWEGWDLTFAKLYAEPGRGVARRGAEGHVPRAPKFRGGNLGREINIT